MDSVLPESPRSCRGVDQHFRSWTINHILGRNLLENERPVFRVFIPIATVADDGVLVNEPPIVRDLQISWVRHGDVDADDVIFTEKTFPGDTERVTVELDSTGNERVVLVAVDVKM